MRAAGGLSGWTALPMTWTTARRPYHADADYLRRFIETQVLP